MTNRIEAVVLAGGMARRMEGRDKGLQYWNDKPLIAYVLERLKSQISNIAINANRNIEQYQQFGCDVFSDNLPDFQGPLSGMATALARTSADFVLFVPCDCPNLPLNLLEKLQSAVSKNRVFAAYAHDGNRAHPTFCLIAKTLAEPLNAYLAQGERRMLQFLEMQNAEVVDFSEQPSAFKNFNYLADLEN